MTTKKGYPMRFAIAVTLAVTLTGAAHAAEPKYPGVVWDAPTPREAAVRRCVEYVRSTTLSPPSHFDAFVQSSTEIRTWGTAADDFQFEKCMASHGRPLFANPTPPQPQPTRRLP
jgi:hypothetical protein